MRWGALLGPVPICWSGSVVPHRGQMQAQAAGKFRDRKNGVGSAVLHRGFRQARDAGMDAVGSTVVGPPVARSDGNVRPVRARFDVVQRGRASCTQTARCACACTGPCTTRATLRRDCSAQGRNLDVHLTSKRLRWGRIFPTMNWSGTSGTDDQGMDVYWTSLWTSIGRPYVDVHEALKTGISALPRPADKAANDPFPKSCSGSSNAACTW